MSDLVTRAQIEMLAETLDVDPSRLRHLERLGADNVRALREQISNVLYDEQEAVFARLIKLAPLVPSLIAAKITEKVTPPLVAGRAAGAIGVAHPHKAKSVLSHISVPYMADAAPYLDPRAVAVLAPIMPPKLLVPAAEELVRRKAFITVSRFIEHAPPELVQAAEAAIDDDVALLKIAALAHPAHRLAAIIRMMPSARVVRIIQVGVQSEELLLDGLSILSRVDAELCADLATHLFAAIEDDGVTDLLRTAVENEAIKELLIVAQSLGPAELARLAGDAYLQNRDTLVRFMTVAAEHDLWPGLNNVLRALPADAATVADELRAHVRGGH